MPALHPSYRMKYSGRRIAIVRNWDEEGNDVMTIPRVEFEWGDLNQEWRFACFTTCVRTSILFIPIPVRIGKYP